MVTLEKKVYVLISNPHVWDRITWRTVQSKIQRCFKTIDLENLIPRNLTQKSDTFCLIQGKQIFQRKKWNNVDEVCWRSDAKRSFLCLREMLLFCWNVFEVRRERGPELEQTHVSMFFCWTCQYIINSQYVKGYRLKVTGQRLKATG